MIAHNIVVTVETSEPQTLTVVADRAENRDVVEEAPPGCHLCRTSQHGVSPLVRVDDTLSADPDLVLDPEEVGVTVFAVPCLVPTVLRPHVSRCWCDESPATILGHDEMARCLVRRVLQHTD